MEFHRFRWVKQQQELYTVAHLCCIYIELHGTFYIYLYRRTRLLDGAEGSIIYITQTEHIAGNYPISDFIIIFYHCIELSLSRWRKTNEPFYISTDVCVCFIDWNYVHIPHTIKVTIRNFTGMMPYKRTNMPPPPKSIMLQTLSTHTRPFYWFTKEGKQ